MMRFMRTREESHVGYVEYSDGISDNPQSSEVLIARYVTYGVGYGPSHVRIKAYKEGHVIHSFQGHK